MRIEWPATPRHTKKSPAPFCHAASSDWRESLRTAYKEFVDSAAGFAIWDWDKM